jgi:hypothetical protein
LNDACFFFHIFIFHFSFPPFQLRQARSDSLPILQLPLDLARLENRGLPRVARIPRG